MKLKKWIVILLLVLALVSVLIVALIKVRSNNYVSFGYYSNVDSHYFIFNNVSNSSILKKTNNGIRYKLRKDEIVIDRIENNLESENTLFIFYNLDEKEYHYNLDSLRFYNINYFLDSSLANEVNLISFYIGDNQESLNKHKEIRDSVLIKNIELYNSSQ